MSANEGEPAGGEGQGPTSPLELMQSRAFILVLALAAVAGVISSLAAFGFLELLHVIETEAYSGLPEALGFSSAPIWWPVPLLVLSGLIVAFAIARLPGNGGHVPVNGLNATPTEPIDLPGVVLAAVAGIGLGMVLGPEAPLIALGGGLGFLLVRSVASGAPPEAGMLIAMASVFAAISFLFGSPLIAAVLLIEAAGLEKERMTLLLVPGLLAAGIGSLVSVGMGSWTGVDNSELALGPVQLPDFPRPEFVDFLWTIPLAAVIAVGVWGIFFIGHRVQAPAASRPFVALPLIGAVIAGLAIVFHEITDKGIQQVLFSGETSIDPLIENAGSWSVGALAALLAFKGIAYGLALGSFRGGPVFPALFLGAAAGVLAAELPGFDLTPAVAVGMGAAVVAVLRLPLSGVLLASILTATAGLGASPLIILGVVVSYLVIIALPSHPADAEAPARGAPPGPGAAPPSPAAAS
jgi:H+/Cl- antiporter ClcA